MAGRDGRGLTLTDETVRVSSAALAGTVAGLRLGSLSDEERAHCLTRFWPVMTMLLLPLRKWGHSFPLFSPFGYGDLADDNGAITAIEAYFNHGHLYEQADLPMDEDVRKRVLSGKTYPAYAYLEMLQKRRSRAGNSSQRCRALTPF